jgi:hypothetical protein
VTIEQFFEQIQDYYGNYPENVLKHVAAYVRAEYKPGQLKALKKYAQRHHPIRYGPPDISDLSKAWYFRRQDQAREYSDAPPPIEDPRTPEDKEKVEKLLGDLKTKLRWR